MNSLRRATIQYAEERSASRWLSHYHELVKLLARFSEVLRQQHESTHHWVGLPGWPSARTTKYPASARFPRGLTTSPTPTHQLIGYLTSWRSLLPVSQDCCLISFYAG